MSWEPSLIQRFCRAELAEGMMGSGFRSAVLGRNLRLGSLAAKARPPVFWWRGRRRWSRRLWPFRPLVPRAGFLWEPETSGRSCQNQEEEHGEGLVLLKVHGPGYFQAQIT